MKQARRVSLPSFLRDASEDGPSDSNPFRLVAYFPLSIDSANSASLSIQNTLLDRRKKKRKRELNDLIQNTTARINNEEVEVVSLIHFEFGDFRTAIYFWLMMTGEHPFCNYRQNKKRKTLDSNEEEKNLSEEKGRSRKCEVYRLITLASRRICGEGQLIKNINGENSVDLSAISKGESLRTFDVDVFPGYIEARESSTLREQVILFATIRDITRIDCDLWW